MCLKPLKRYQIDIASLPVADWSWVHSLATHLAGKSEKASIYRMECVQDLEEVKCEGGWICMDTSDRLKKKDVSVKIIGR